MKRLEAARLASETGVLRRWERWYLGGVNSPVRGSRPFTDEEGKLEG